MLERSELLRFVGAMVYSGIFWSTILFLVNACALNRRVPFLGVGAATGVLVLMVYLFAGVVARPEAFAMTW